MTEERPDHELERLDARLKEASKLGFTRALAPRGRRAGADEEALEVHEIDRVRDLAALLGADAA